MDTRVHDIIYSFLYKKLRKTDYTCEITSRKVTASDCFLDFKFNIYDILAYINHDLEVLYWIFDRMWEDWIVLVSNTSVDKIPYQNLDNSAKKIIDKVKDNLKTPLGSRTNYIDKYDPTLLVPVKRQPTREAIGYEYVPFQGLDVWNGYELSYLDKNGKPVNRMIRLAYDSDSESIIESKSLKLYFNSFNNTIIENLDKGSIIDIIKQDLKEAVKANTIEASFLGSEYSQNKCCYYSLDQLYCDTYSYNYNPELLLIKPTESIYPVFLKTELLKSNCRHSGLPDWGTAYISYQPNTAELDTRSLLQYIISFRNHREFHEECCERIMHDILFKINPKWLRVELRYTRRGGLDINPIRVYDSIGKYSYDFDTELSRYIREVRQ